MSWDEQYEAVIGLEVHAQLLIEFKYRIPKILKFISIFLLVFLLACSSKQTKYDLKQIVNVENKIDTMFYTTIKKQFYIIDSLKCTDNCDFERVDSLSDNIISILEKYKETIIELPDKVNYDLLYIAKSYDKNICLVSWDTRQGGTMIDFATMAIFKSPTGIKTKLLHNDTTESFNTYMHYNTISTLKTFDNKTIYIAQGFGQGSTALPWQEIRAFAINADTIFHPKIFSDTSSNVFVEFDTHQFSNRENIPTIKLKSDGDTILVPQSTSKEGFSGKYQTLIFNDTNYISR